MKQGILREASSRPIEVNVPPPHVTDSEKVVIGAMLRDPVAFQTIKHRLLPDDFWLLRYREFWAAGLELERDGLAVDETTLRGRLLERGELTDQEIMLTMTEVGSFRMNTEHAETHATEIKHHAYRRSLLNYASVVAQSAHDGSRRIADIHRDLNQSLNQLVGAALTRPTTLYDLNSRYIDQLQEAARTNTTRTGYSTGFPMLDRLLGHAYGPASFTGIGGYMNSAKTFLLIQMALAAVRQDIPTLFVTLESAPEVINERLISIESGVPLDDVMALSARGESMQAIFEAQGRLDGLPLEIDVLETLPAIEARINDLSVRYNFAPVAVFIDDLDTLSNSERGSGDYDRLKRLIPKLLPLALRTKACIVGSKHLRVPGDINAGTTNDTLYERLKPTIRSFEGGNTLMQKASNGLALWSANWIQDKIKGSFEHADLEPGYIYFRKLRARDTRSSGVGGVALRWNADIPRFENIDSQDSNGSGLYGGRYD